MALSDANPNVEGRGDIKEARPAPRMRASLARARSLRLWPSTGVPSMSLQLDLDFLTIFELEWNALLLHLEEIVAGRQRHLADGGVYDPGLAAVAQCDVVVSDAGSGDLEHARMERRGLPRLELNIWPYQVTEGHRKA